MVDSTDPGWLQSAFYFLTGLFDGVVLQTNVIKTVWVVFRTCWAAGVSSDKAYTCRMTRDAGGFKEQQRERVLCPECVKDLAKGSLVTHRQTQHGMAK